MNYKRQNPLLNIKGAIHLNLKHPREKIDVVQSEVEN